MTANDVLVQARALLEGDGISPDDSAAFLADLTTALTGTDAPKLKVAADRRQLWARVLLVVAGFLLGPPAPETPPPEKADEEEEEVLLTLSEFEIWNQIKEQAKAAAATTASAQAAEEQPGPADITPPAESESAEEEEATEAEAPAPPAADDFEDFVIDEVTVEQ
jgi:hypothetical protein